MHAVIIYRTCKECNHSLNRAVKETSVYMVHNSLKKIITVFQRFDPNSCKCTSGVSMFQLQTGFPVHFSVEKLGRVTCHMIALSICPSSSVAGPTFG